MKILLFANTEWYLYNFRLALAETLRARGDEVILLSPPGPYGKRLEEQGFRWIPFDFARRGTNPAAEAVTVARLAAVYRRERPDVVHHFTIKCVLYGSIAARATGVRGIVNSLTGLGYVFSDTSARARLLRTVATVLYRAATGGTRFIFQNPDDQAVLRNLGVAPDDRSWLIRGSGVDTARFTPETKPQEAPARALFASRLLWAKGVGDYVEAARRVRRRHPEAVFWLAGSSDPGNPDAIDSAQINAWKDEGAVEVLGHCDDMLSLYRQASVVALPTVYGEGVPRVLIEGAACGLPLVATDHPGCREIVRHEQTGLLVPAQDPQALAEALERVMFDADMARALGQGARALAEAEFSQGHVIPATLNVYDHALSGTTRPGLTPRHGTT